MKAFILDVDWSTQGVKVILSQKYGRNEHVIVYTNMGLSLIQKKFHSMEGECYALVWGIMHFKQYLYHNYFTSWIDHKPLDRY